MFGTYNVVMPTEIGDFLVYNTLSKAAVSLKASEFQRVRDGIVTNSFLRRSLIVCDRVDEEQALQRYIRAVLHRDELHVTITLTRKCNFSCAYCFQVSEKNVDMCDETANKLIDWISTQVNGSRYSVVHIVFYGGEPLLNMQRLTDMAKSISCAVGETRLRMSIITNGWYLIPPIIQELAAVGVDSVQVTLDGHASTHNARRPLMDGSGTQAQRSLQKARI